jgi:predicted nucleic acid-binding protein
MKVFADTNFFTSVWLDLEFTDSAASLMTGLQSGGETLPVTRLIRMEFTNALQRLVFEAKHGSQILRMSQEVAMLTRARFDEELAAGELLHWSPIPEDELEEAFEMLAYRYTAKHGFRTYDLLHVASALLLGCDTFWSFDVKARKLAKLEGMKVNPVPR